MRRKIHENFKTASSLNKKFTGSFKINCIRIRILWITAMFNSLTIKRTTDIQTWCTARHCPLKRAGMLKVRHMMKFYPVRVQSSAFSGRNCLAVK